MQYGLADSSSPIADAAGAQAGGRVRARLCLAAILILGVSGAWISGQLVKQHADIWGQQGAKASLFVRMCHAAERAGFNCAAAVQGRWGQFGVPVPLLSRGWGVEVRRVEVPVAFLGLAYFVFMIVWFTFAGGLRSAGRWRLVPRAVAACGIAVSVVLLAVMASGVAPWCLWCVAIHLINCLMAGAIWRLSGDTGTTRKMLSAREATNVIVFALILIAGMWVYRREHVALGAQMSKLRPYKALVTSLRKDPAFMLREHYAQPQYAIPTRDGEPDERDRPRLTVFTDFECPACFCNAQVIHNRIAEAFGGRLVLQIRHFPLCGDCNDTVEGAFHPNACDAARAAEAARLQGGAEAFARMYRLLFRNRDRLSRDIYADLATQIGLDADRLMSDMRGDAVARVLRSDMALARELGVRGTPTMFLNGRLITELCEGDVFWEAAAESWATSLAQSADSAAAFSSFDPTRHRGSRRP